MNATNKLLDKWWKVCMPATAIDAGKALGVSGQAIANYRSGLSQAAPHVIATMAKEIGEDPAAWLALVESERARSADDRKTWATLARRFGAAATIALCAVVPFQVADAQGHIATNAYYVALAGLLTAWLAWSKLRLLQEIPA